ncbi:carboxypeptidase-like regulatory domain-containing protein, partial [bacterium]|nr:carboxypeptidase-like regulatory domain-containing protein [bacterium]
MSNRVLLILSIIVCLIVIGVIVFLPTIDTTKQNADRQMEAQSILPTPTQAIVSQPTPIPTPTPRQIIEQTTDDSDLLVPPSESNNQYAANKSNPENRIQPTPFVPEAGKLVGRVIDSNGAPIASAKIMLQAVQGIWVKELHADYAGRFVENDPPDRALILRASMSGYWDAGKGNTQIEANYPNEVLLQLSASEYSISGRVVNRENQSPVQGFALMLSNGSEQQTANTDPTGSFRFPSVSIGKYQITENSAANSSIGFALAANQNRRSIIITQQSVNDIKLEAVPSISVQGKVVTNNNEPVSNAVISLLHSNAEDVRSNEEGAFQFQAANGAVLKARQPDIGTGVSEPVTNDNRDNLVIRLQEPASVFGTVTNQNKEPIAGVKVTLKERIQPQNSYDAQTNDKGIYSIDEIPLISKGEKEEQYTHTLMFEKEGYASESQNVILYSGEITTQNAVLQSGSSIRGRVIDESGQPLPGAHIEAYDKGALAASAESDPSGAFNLLSLPQGAFMLKATFDSNPPLQKTLFSVASGETGVEFQLTSSMQLLTGQVTIQDSGQPIQNFGVIAEGKSGDANFIQQISVQTADGRY